MPTATRAAASAPRISPPRRTFRHLSRACFAFNGLPTVFTAYFVIALTEMGYSPTEAGVMFSVAMVLAAPGRIFWGWRSSTVVAPRVMMGGLALGMAATALSGTAMSWHGVLSFGQTGALLMPLAHALLLRLTGSHGWGFALCGLPALAVGIALLRRPPTAQPAG